MVIHERNALYVGNVGDMLSVCERDTPARPHWRHHHVAIMRVVCQVQRGDTLSVEAG